MLVECAPIAGYTNAEFRSALVECGAKVVYTEMISVAAIYYGNKKTLKLLESDFDTRVKHVVQIFGYKPEHFTFAIESGSFDGYDEININMGCPATKIIKNNEGVALMANPNKAKEIIETCVKAAKVPVTVKIRLGKNYGCDYVAFAKTCEMAGAKRIIVHGRYGEQGYSGVADWDKIAEIVKSVNVPVIANGDIRSLADAEKCLAVTGASGVMIGRVLLPLYKKYFSGNLRILRGEKICRDGGVSDCIVSVLGLFEASEKPAN